MQDLFYKLFDKDLVFISKAKTKEEVFRNLSDYLLEKNYVNEDFYDMILKREREHPTGINTFKFNQVKSDIAIPHTESYCVNITKIVPIKLEEEIYFTNMLDSKEELRVKFLFVILNKDGAEQTNILMHIMNFASTPGRLKELFKLQSEEEIYKYLEKNFINI
jgi:mannitol/fructose-specific phosphotransferase system IIA component (Ntr-type)